MKNYIIYQITNKINGMIYIGCHVTNNINDSYMGSGSNIRKAFKEFSKENFTKEILFVYDNKEEMLAKELELVNKEFIARQDTYNIILGGGAFLTLDTISVKDKYNNRFRIHKTDPKYLSGEYCPITTGYLNVKDENNNIIKVSIYNPKYLSGEYKSLLYDTIIVKDINNNYSIVNKTDPKYLSGELIPGAKNTITVKDINNNNFRVDQNDPRYLSGELKHIWVGRKHTNETLKKIQENRTKTDTSGINNSMYGKNHSEESKHKISEALIGKYITTFYVYDILGNFIAEEKGVKQYAKREKISRSGISAVLNNKKENYKNKIFFYQYKGENCFIDI